MFDNREYKLQLRPALYVLIVVMVLALTGVHVVSIGVMLLIVALVLLRNWVLVVARWLAR